MCGIAGYVVKDGKSIDTSLQVVRMLDVQRHRGPDDSGLRSFSMLKNRSVEHNPFLHEVLPSGTDGVLGFNRLSIVDLSINGHQPMCAVDDQVMLAFNGEIYNAPEFVPGLRAQGYSFRGHSDTEVILNLYLKYGFETMLSMLNGMFAIVLIDLRVHKMFMARDRFGIKPMYLLETKEVFAFSSEQKSFFALSEFSPELNLNAFDEFLLFRNTLNGSLFKGVKSLTPGTWLEFQVGQPVKEHIFYDIEANHRQPVKTNLEGSARMVESSLSTSVSRQLLSDVKLGCQLSGGIDSSLVTWLAKQAGSKDSMETVSVVMDDARFDEEQYINHVTQKLGIVSHKFKLESSYYLRHLTKATWHFENPINHPNTIGIYLLSERAKEHVTVLLSGEGADEVFGGYDRFARVLHPWHWRNAMLAVRRTRGSFTALAQQYGSDTNRSVWATAFLSAEQATEMYPQFDLDNAIGERQQVFGALTGSSFDRMMKYEMKTYLPDLLMRQDKMSMAHSIENRVPFLDNDMVTSSFKLPQAHLLAGAIGKDTKIVLKELASKVFGVPFAIRPKQGFGIPLRSFFLDPEFLVYLNDAIIPGIRQHGLLNASMISQWVARLKTIHSDQLDALWVAISFEVWRQQFFQSSHKIHSNVAHSHP